jgi:hypothetical protein
MIPTTGHNPRTENTLSRVWFTTTVSGKVIESAAREEQTDNEKNNKSPGKSLKAPRNETGYRFVFPPNSPNKFRLNFLGKSGIAGMEADPSQDAPGRLTSQLPMGSGKNPQDTKND